MAHKPIPKGLPKKYHKYWRRPWLRRASWSRGFRRHLARRGYLTPHFRISEAKCKDGTPVPKHLMRRCRGHAFRLERIRHATGDKPMPITSWFRHEVYNRRIGGASRSKHIEAIATDHPKQWVDARGGQSRLVGVARNANIRGCGVYPGGAMHFDSRTGPFTTWTSW